MVNITASQAWAVLVRHAQEDIGPLSLLLRDNDRVSALVSVHNSTFEPSSTLAGKSDHNDKNRILILDLSRQRMTVETLNKLLNLAAARNLKSFILQLACGQNNRKEPRVRTDSSRKHQKHQQSASMCSPRTDTQETKSIQSEMLPSMHLALRAPRGCVMLLADGTNALTAIHREWDRLERLSDSMRRGQLRGATGSMIRDVIVIGRGTPVAALQFIYSALLKDERAVLATRFGLVEAAATRIRRNLSGGTAQPPLARTLRFLSTVDPIAAAALLADLDPAATLVISIALNGNEETGMATKTVKSWLLHALGATRRADQILSKHMLLVTGNDRIVSVINKPERVHIVPKHSRCEAFTTFSPAGLLVST
jgi:glucose-6-phosphate isomerase